MPSCDQYVDAYLADYALRNRSNSLETETGRLRRFREDFKGRSLDISRAEFKQWVYGEGPWSRRGQLPKWEVTGIITLYNYAIDHSDLPLRRSPARNLRPRQKRWADQAPPTRQEFEALVDACSTLGDYGKIVRAALLFATHTLLRPSELYVLEWTDIDFGQMRIRTRDRLDAARTRTRVVALTPRADDAIRRLPRDSKWVFISKTGKPLTGQSFRRQWLTVREAARLNFSFHHVTKHYGVHYMWTELEVSPQAIAAQAGWTLHTVDRILAAYGYGEGGGLEEIDAAFQRLVNSRSRDVSQRLDSPCSSTAK
jgi:integrase